VSEYGKRPRPGELVDAYYSECYAKVHGSGQLNKANAAMHNSLEKRRSGQSYDITLELGAGEFQHYPYVQHSRTQYIAGDIRVPAKSPIWQALEQGTGPADLRFCEMDATSIPMPTGFADRVVATCLIMHLPDPFSVLQEWQRVCGDGGVIDFLVPCDPGLALRAFRRLISEPTAQRVGVSAEEHRLVNAIDHVSAFPRILTLAKAALEPNRKLIVDYFPLKIIKSWNINAFAVLSIEPS